MATTRFVVALVAVMQPLAYGLSLHDSSSASIAANPIRKVVKMLQAMQTKVQAEAEKEEALYKKYMCYCKTAGGDLAESIASAEAKAPEVASSIKGGEAEKVQLDADLVKHKE